MAGAGACCGSGPGACRALRAIPSHTHTREHEQTADGTNEWLFKRMPRPQRSEQEKKMREKKIRKGEIDPKEDDVDKDAWKRPWLVTYDEDTDFSHVFEARREGDKRSKSHKLCRVTLAKVQMKALKGVHGRALHGHCAARQTSKHTTV